MKFFYLPIVIAMAIPTLSYGAHFQVVDEETRDFDAHKTTYKTIKCEMDAGTYIATAERLGLDSSELNPKYNMIAPSRSSSAASQALLDNMTFGLSGAYLSGLPEGTRVSSGGNLVTVASEKNPFYQSETKLQSFLINRGFHTIVFEKPNGEKLEFKLWMTSVGTCILDWNEIQNALKQARAKSERPAAEEPQDQGNAASAQ